MNEGDLRDLYLLLEDLNDFFHQPDNYASAADTSDFATTNYPRIRQMYYETVWNVLPESLKQEFINR